MTSAITSTDLEALLVARGDPTAGEMTAAYNRPRRGRGRVHVSSMKRALHRHDYVVNQNAACRRKWHDPPSSTSGADS